MLDQNEHARDAQRRSIEFRASDEAIARVLRMRCIRATR